MSPFAPVSVSVLPQAVLFDWDNTLIENWAALTASMNEALRAFSLPLWDEARMIENSKHSLRDSFPVIFGKHWEKAREVFYAHFRARHLDGVHKLVGADDLLQLLQEHGVKLAVCSNKNGELLRREVKKVGWTQHFSSVIGAQDAEKDKPDAAPARLILQANNLLAGPHVWFVGDTATDMMCASRAGCLAVGVGPGARENPDYQPELWFPDLPALLTAFKTLLS